NLLSTQQRSQKQIIRTTLAIWRLPTMMSIKESRKAAGLTQKQMSEVFDIPQRTIEDWETGKRTPPAYVEKLIVEKLERIRTEQV
ncbi:MAG: helix-turn-helix transcriptional regulator, partial [Clostridia bacterium]|nr:helix-turn-helix transcriptional regulator [Clostridia bacterium]